MKRLICTTTLLLLTSIAVFADLPRPEKSPGSVKKPGKAIDTTLRIRLDRNATEARLLIPKSQIKELRAALDDLDGDDASTAATSVASYSRTQTIVGGIFLSLAFVFGGIWFVRSGNNLKKPGRTIAMLAIATGIGSAATFVYANIAPPLEARTITGKMFAPSVHAYGRGSGKIKLEVVDSPLSPELIVPNPKDEPRAEE